MSTQQYVQLAVMENQAFALMARLHVMMRRQDNRVTDIEYMRINPDYCRHLIELAMHSPHEDLQNIAVKLKEVFFGEHGLFVLAPPKPPLFERRKNAAVLPPAASAPPPKSKPQPEKKSAPEHAAELNRAYVGCLR